MLRARRVVHLLDLNARAGAARAAVSHARRGYRGVHVRARVHSARDTAVQLVTARLQRRQRGRVHVRYVKGCFATSFNS